MSEPQQVFLFSGHMIDAATRATPRFPPDKEPIAAQAIEAVLAEFGASADDLGMTEGACGGDLLFAEALLGRGARLELRLPFDEPTFLRESVDFEKPTSAAPDLWHDRFMRVKRRARVLTMPEALGPTPEGDSPYERCNLWMLEEALGMGAHKLRFICLWDGGGGDGRGGTKHMVEEVRSRGGEVRWLDVKKLW
ncbi:MAG: hypothetical protein EHM59_04975 [Betaproteobacteria bacterium]|nr:MAG: hypothetical protein EHM59_04975 [Betaproteobacteria bacterium]